MYGPNMLLKTSKNFDNHPNDKTFITAGLALAFLLITGCTTGDEENRDKNVTLGKYELSNGWVRPGSKGGNSAAYLRITNGTAIDDTLIAISSDISERTSLHESIEKDGLTEMHTIADVSIESGSSMTLEPGGKHIMLMQLNNDVSEGDSVNLNFEFAQAGEKEVTLPVQLQE